MPFIFNYSEWKTQNNFQSAFLSHLHTPSWSPHIIDSISKKALEPLCSTVSPVSPIAIQDFITFYLNTRKSKQMKKSNLPPLQSVYNLYSNYIYFPLLLESSLKIHWMRWHFYVCSESTLVSSSWSTILPPFIPGKHSLIINESSKYHSFK